MRAILDEQQNTITVSWNVTACSLLANNNI